MSLVISALLVGHCLAAKARPEGWPVTYQVVKVTPKELQVNTIVQPANRAPEKKKGDWIKKRIRAPLDKYEEVPCPLTRQPAPLPSTKNSF